MWSFLHLFTTQCFECRLSSNVYLPQHRNRKHLRLRSCPAAFRLAFVAEAKRRACSGRAPAHWRALGTCSHCVCALLYRRCARAGLRMCSNAQLCAASSAPPVWRAEACQAKHLACSTEADIALHCRRTRDRKRKAATCGRLQVRPTPLPAAARSARVLTTGDAACQRGAWASCWAALRATAQ